MVYDNRRQPQVDRRNTKEDVIDLGSPRPDLSAPRLRNYAQKIGSGANARVTADSKLQKPLGEFENELNLGGSPKKASKRRRPGRRRTTAFASPLYTPNPRLYQAVHTSGKPAQAPVKKAGLKKGVIQGPRGAESPVRVVKRHKRKARRYLPNPRLYQAPPPTRPQVHSIPPLCPRTGWLPSSESAPQNTASQIALQFSERTIIPFRELLPVAIKSPIVKPFDSQLPPRPTPRDKIWEMVAAHPGKERDSTREKKQSSKSIESPRLSARDKTQKVKSRISSAKNKKVSAEKRPKSPTHFLPKEATVGLQTLDLPTLDDIPHLAHAESFIPNYVNPPPKRYRPRSQHFRLRTLDSNSSSSSPPPAARLPSPVGLLPEAEMAASPHPSITPEDGSDGNDSLSSAPSEYLAEFLSAIMSRNYAEALKYCRLILHYEPHNSTARGFYPLLRYKLGLSQSPLSLGATFDGKVLGSSNSEGSSSGVGAAARSGPSPDGVEDLEKGSDSEAESVASLSLDSSEKSSRSASPAARGTDSSASECSPEILGVTDVTAVGANWLADDNGNPRSESNKHNRHSDDEDDENDNAPSRLVLKDMDIRQLRAQFACSIK